jgi:hypothetical protein
VTYLINESHIGQQLLCAICIAADDIRSSTGVEPIQRLHGVLNFRFKLGEEAHVAIYELKAHINLCPMRQTNKTLPLCLGVIDQDMTPLHMPLSIRPLPILPLNKVTGMHPCSSACIGIELGQSQPHDHGYRLIHGESGSCILCKGGTDQVPMMYLIGLPPCLFPTQSVTGIIRYLIREVTCEGNLGGQICIFGSLTIYPSVFEF